MNEIPHRLAEESHCTPRDFRECAERGFAPGGTNTSADDRIGVAPPHHRRTADGSGSPGLTPPVCKAKVLSRIAALNDGTPMSNTDTPIALTLPAQPITGEVLLEKYAKGDE